ncbi:MAG TPA: MFS transporter [Candidatus Dormibacteraeota bacterium]
MSEHRRRRWQLSGARAAEGVGTLRPRLLLLLSLAAGALFLGALDAYAVATLLPHMLADLNLSVDHLEQASPIVAGFLGGYVVAMPLLGAFSDARGRVPAVLIALAVFAAGSVLTGLAGSLFWLVAGRTVQGLGGGALVPLALAMAADSAAGPARVRALGAVAAVQEAGSVMGPVYGTVLALWLARFGGWRAVFLIDLPIAVVLAIAIWFLRPAAPPPPLRGGISPPSGEETRVDWQAALLLACGLGALVAGLYPDNPELHPLNPYAPWFLLLAGLLLGGFGWRQWRRLGPLLPSRVLHSAGFWGALGVNLLVGGGLMVALVDIPIFARAVFNVDQNAAGLLLTSFLAGVPLGALAGGWLAARLGFRWPALVGLILASALFWVLAGWGVGELHTHVWLLRRTDVELIGLGFGFGLVIAPLAAAALASSRSEHGLVSSLVVAARTIGMLVGLSALTAFGLWRFNQLLTARPQPPDTMSLSERLHYLEKGVTQALLVEYHEIFLITAAICLAAAAVCALTLRPSEEPRPAGAG